MESTEVVTPADQSAVSAPANETEVQADQNVESAPTETTEGNSQNIEEEGAKPVEKTVPVSEHIAQRKKRQAAEQRVAYLEGMLAAKTPQAVTPQAPPPVVNATLQEPVSDNFETWEDYERAQRRYLVDLAKYEIAQEQRNRAQQEQVVKLRSSFDAKIELAAQEDPTILDIREDLTLPVSQAMASLIQESDAAPDLLKWLHNNRKEAQRIAGMPPLQAAREMGRVEFEIQNKPKPEPPKKVSLAPEPIKTVQPSGAGVVDENNLPIDEWVKRRNQAQFKRK